MENKLKDLEAQYLRSKSIFIRYFKNSVNVQNLLHFIVGDTVVTMLKAFS